MNKKGRPPSDSFVEMTELILPQHTNWLGTAFGGVIMSWVDIAAAICASSACTCAWSCAMAELPLVAPLVVLLATGVEAGVYEPPPPPPPPPPPELTGAPLLPPLLLLLLLLLEAGLRALLEQALDEGVIVTVSPLEPEDGSTNVNSD